MRLMDHNWTVTDERWLCSRLLCFTHPPFVELPLLFQLECVTEQSDIEGTSHRAFVAFEEHDLDRVQSGSQVR